MSFHEVSAHSIIGIEPLFKEAVKSAHSYQHREDLGGIRIGFSHQAINLKTMKSKKGQYVKGRDTMSKHRRKGSGNSQKSTDSDSKRCKC
jgi:hypothetical protein